jgi:hypothetical protein
MWGPFVTIASMFGNEVNDKGNFSHGNLNKRVFYQWHSEDDGKELSFLDENVEQFGVRSTNSYACNRTFYSNPGYLSKIILLVFLLFIRNSKA